jgi:putative glutamine amidotransferase
MAKPIIGITSHALAGPISHPSIGAVLRSGANQVYVDSVVAAGGAPLLIPLGLDSEALRAVYSAIDGLLLPGGDDVAPERYGQDRHEKLGSVDETRDELEITVARWALDDDIPILGICRGIQVLTVAAGGTLYQDLVSQWQSDLGHDVREFGRDHLCHALSIQPGSRLAAAIGCTDAHVNSFHHQAVWSVPPDFAVTATAPDGVVEAIESTKHDFVVGVQCHPEAIWASTAPEFAGLFREFVRSAAQRVELAS